MNSVMDKNNKRDVSIMLVRIIAAAFIFIDHFLMYVDFPFKNVIIQVTNSGVFIFLFISGYLYGGKKITNWKLWINGRIKRLFVPYWLFLAVYYLYQYLNNTFDKKSFIIYLLDLQGLLGTENGPKSLWFMTLLFICYLLIPILQKYKNMKFEHSIVLDCFFIVLQVILAFCSSVKLDVGHSLSWYIVALYVFGFGYKSNGKMNEHNCNRIVFISTPLMLFCVIIRFLVHKYYDGSIFYDEIVSVWTNLIIDVWLFFFIRFIAINCPKVFEKKIVYVFINFFDSVSYTFYLVHVFVIELLFSSAHSNMFLFFCLSLFIAIAFSYLLNVISGCIIALLSKRKVMN